MRSGRVGLGLSCAVIGCLAGVLGGCYDDDTAGAGAGGSTVTAGHVDGVGTDEAGTAACLGCHTEIQEAWSHASSHEVLFDCNGCHRLGPLLPHAKPVVLPTCDRCHSEAAHPAGGTSSCTDCHDPHGSSNLFLIRKAIRLPSGEVAGVVLTELEGASPGGRVRAGVDGEKPGTGLCEVCHTTTKHYDSAGTAAPHETGWCADCHDHQKGFAPSAAPP